MFREVLGVIRQSNPARTVIIGPGDYNEIDYLEQLDLPENDRNIIVTVHYYSPIEFTHQGLRCLGREIPVGRPGAALSSSGKRLSTTSKRLRPGRSETAVLYSWASSAPTARPTWPPAPAGRIAYGKRRRNSAGVGPTGTSTRASPSTIFCKTLARADPRRADPSVRSNRMLAKAIESWRPSNGDSS